MLKHSLQFKLSQKLSPQQIQLMKLIQLPTQAFEQRLQEELVENPALEETSKEDDYEADDYEVNTNDDDYDDYDNDHIDSGDINIDEYLSNDETPDYKYQTNNYILYLKLCWNKNQNYLNLYYYNLNINYLYR